jgi:hypothetical protein
MAAAAMVLTVAAQTEPPEQPTRAAVEAVVAILETQVRSTAKQAALVS